MLKDKIAIIGIGQCGGNIAVQAERQGFSTGVINTSEEDISSENMNIITNKLIVGHTGGCGKDRTIGQQIVKEEYKTIIKFINDNFIDKYKDLKIIYFAFSTSGGTGSGISPILINVISKMYEDVDRDITFAAIAVVPETKESTVSLFNSRKCLEELYRLDIPIMIPDNSKASDRSSRKALYDNINWNTINGLVSLIDEREPSSIANMDEKDKLKLLTTNGVTIICKSPLVVNDMKDANSLANTIQVALSHSVFSSIDFDGIVKRVGYVFEIPEENSKFIDYKEINKNIGNPIEIFEGIYPKDKNDIYSFTIILTGLSFPQNKIVEIDSKLKNDTEATKKIMESRNENIFDSLSGTNGIDDLFKEDTKKKKSSGKKMKSTTDLFGGFDLDDDSSSLEDIFGNY